MNDNFLIPANSKKSMKILGLFEWTDIIILGIGIFLTFLLIMVLDLGDIVLAIIALLPISICGFLVFPIPNYHNVRRFLMSTWEFFTERRTFIWKGWCIIDEEKNSKK